MKIKQKIFLIVFGLMLAVVLLEIGLRVMKNSNPSIKDREIVRISLEKDAYNIFCLGDSYTYGIGAGFENSYPVHLEKILNERWPGQKFKIWNLGVPGCNSTQVLFRLKEIIKSSKPDCVIVLAGGNDSWNFEHVLTKGAVLGLKSEILLSSAKVSRLVTILLENIKAKISESKQIQPDFVNWEKENDAAKLVLLGNLFRERSFFPEALKCYQKALKIQPGNNDAVLEMGRCYKGSGEYDKAAELFEEALRLSPQDQKLYAELEDIFIQAGMVDAAIKFYSKILADSPNNEYARESLGKWYIYLAGYFLENNELASASIFYQKAYTLNPEDKKARWGIKTAAFLRSRQNNFLKLISAQYKDDRVKRMQYHAIRSIKPVKDIVNKITFDNFGEIAKICKKNSILLIFSSYPRGSTQTEANAALISFVPLVKHDQVFNELLESRPLKKYFVSADDFHCTSEGYRIMAENIARELNNYLKNTLPETNSP